MRFPRMFFYLLSGMDYICVNGEMVPADQPVFRAGNRGYRYGDGLFETMKMLRKRICLEPLHWERFFAGLKLLQFEIPASLAAGKLKEQVLHLCEKNKCEESARIRLSASRGDGGLYDNHSASGYIIECWPVNDSVSQLNENGFAVDVYTAARKSCDAFSNLKSANYLPYVMAARYAKENKLDDCLVLNHDDRVADATIANVFLVKDKQVFTPPLPEGCISGVMRRYLLESCRGTAWQVQERPITQKELETADELFLTNALYGIRWVKQFRDKSYTCTMAKEIYNRFVRTIWE
jgi:branched-chain amino acid aminotransferase